MLKIHQLSEDPMYSTLFGSRQNAAVFRQCILHSLEIIKVR